MITKEQSKILLFLVDNKVLSGAACMIDDEDDPSEWPESLRVQHFSKG